jgi:nicotinamidase-related amidase
MQTDFCINATTRRAVKFGYRVTLVSDAHSTFDAAEKTAAEIITEHNLALGKIAVITCTDDVDFQA